jgi:hypothetical protein
MTTDPREEQAELNRGLASLHEKSNQTNKESEQKEKHRQQTAPANKTRKKNRTAVNNKKLRKEADDAAAKIIAEEKERIKSLRTSITEEMITSKMRPFRRYNRKKSSFTDDPDKLMHTVKSAELTILKEGYTPEPAVLSLTKKKSIGPPIRGLRESQHGHYYTKLDQVSDDTAWQALSFFNGYTYEIFPVPPPVTDTPPIINDEQWEDLLQQSRAYCGEDATAFSTLCDRLPLPPLDGGLPNLTYKEESLFSKALGCLQDRSNLTTRLKEMGLLQYDGHYDGLSAIYNSAWGDDSDDFSTDTYESNPEEIIKADPRCLWRDLHHTINSSDESNKLRTQIQELIYQAFLAGMEHQKHRMLRDRQDDIRDSHEFIKKKKKGRPRKKTTETYAEITAAYYKQQEGLQIGSDTLIERDFFPKSAIDIITFIAKSNNASWKKLIYIKPKSKSTSTPSGDIENKNRKLKDWIYQEREAYWRHVHELLK